jgi:hypothetical protein
LVISFNTIISGIDIFGISIGNISSVAAFVVISVYAFIAILLHGMTKKWVGAWLILAGIIGVLYCIIWIANADPGFKSQFFAVALLCLAPLAWLAAMESNDDGELINDFVNVVVFLALTSTLLWVLGPILGVIRPNVSIGSDWASSSGLSLATDGYFYLLFCPQTIVKFGVLITRNTGIFFEAPMYSFVLCLALVGEVFRRQHEPRVWVVVILTVTLVTTFSTTGYLIGGVSVAWAITERHHSYHKGNMGLTVGRALFIVIVGLLGFLAIKLLFDKLGSVSGSVRLDDLKAGFQAWLTSPVVGHGISNAQAANDFKDVSRQQGGLAMSNSLGDALSRGGILLFLIFAGGFLGFLKSDSRKMRIAGMAIGVMWTFTIVTFESLVMVVLGLGYAELIIYLQNQSDWKRRTQKCKHSSQPNKRSAKEIALRVIFKVILIPVMGAAAVWVMCPFFPKRYEVQNQVVLYDVSNPNESGVVALGDEVSVQNVSKMLVNYEQFHRTAMNLGITIAEDYYVSSSPNANSTIVLTCSASSPESARTFLAELIRVGQQMEYLIDFNLKLGNEGEISISQVQPNKALCTGAVFGSLLFLNVGMLLSISHERKLFLGGMSYDINE